MKKIKVFLQFPWKYSDSPYYKFLLDSPPKDIDYIKRKKEGLIKKRKKFLVNNLTKKIIRYFFKAFYSAAPNAHLTKSQHDFDLIHCAHCISKNKRPWICDVEYRSQMWITTNKKPRNKKVAKILLSPHCKKILPWTEKCKEEIIKTFNDSRIESKIEVVCPGIPLPKIKRKKSKEITLLFAARYFYKKGGLHALVAIDRCIKMNKNVRAIITGKIPLEILNKYRENKKIKFCGLVSQKHMYDEIYPQCDILIYPGYSDSFGFAITEALSFGIPVITVDGYSKRELVEDGKTGYVIPAKYRIHQRSIGPYEKKVIDSLIEKTNTLIKNKKLRNNMGMSARREVETGKFSIRKRNEKLKKIYSEAIK